MTTVESPYLSPSYVESVLRPLWARLPEDERGTFEEYVEKIRALCPGNSRVGGRKKKKTEES